MPSGDAHRLCKLGVSAPNPAARPVVKLHCQILIQVLVSYRRFGEQYSGFSSYGCLWGVRDPG